MIRSMMKALLMPLIGLLAGPALAATDKDLKDDPDVLSVEAFQTQVTAKGGRCDFIFSDDRPFKQCHASTVLQAGNGDLLCAWFGGDHERHRNVAIWMARFTNGAWSKPESVAKIEQVAHWNPVLFADPEGTLYLFFKVGKRETIWKTYWQQSKDHGLTWSAAAELVTGDIGGRGPVKNKPILLSNGTWLAGASTELHRDAPFADCSADHGKTWTRSLDWVIDKKALKGTGAIQPAVWESPAGKVHALLRSDGGRIWRSDSEDFGKTWTPVRVTELPNNNSGIDVLRLEDGRLFLVYNPIGDNDGARTPLDLAVSTDDGNTWKRIAHLENDPDPDTEYSYPAIVRTKTGIAISYTWRRERMRCWQIPLEAL